VPWMTRTTTTRTKAGFRTPVREPVDIDDHPLGSAAPTDDSPNSDDFSQVAPPSALTEGDSNQYSVPLEQEDSAPQVETLFGDEEDMKEEALKPEEPSLSEQDEALTEDGEESSYGDASNFATVPNLQRLVVLDSDHCQSPCHITNKDGVKTPSSCGKRATSCQ
jgi:hypothetical protein